ncbi:hypothetical protein E4U42_001913 [Claviceps africana]|uniref:BZIP domain-containing protein n=1 Tax=Claviceps africana TaxID=83212 RepID=A0A8K0NMM2_9HYPO|nr:hypothetical protein E4U42_001913 [Claviceps africana]
MSGNNNKNVPERTQNQPIRHLRSRSVLLSTQNNNSGGMSLPMGGQTASGSTFMPAQSIQPHMMHRRSGSGGLAMPQATGDIGLGIQGMYNSAQSHAMSQSLPFSSLTQPVSGLSGFGQQQLYSPSDHTFQVPGSAFETGTSSIFSGRVFHGYTFKDLKIEFVVPNLTDIRQAQLRALRRLECLTENPPVLPENTVEEMRPKKVFPDYVKLGEDASKAEQLAAEKINNEIAAESLRVDRERNNEAAKRSRRLKNENLENANKLLVQNALHIAWLEAQLSAMGGCPDAFDSINPNIKQRLHGKIIDSRDSFYERRRKEKSKMDIKKRSEHNRKRAAQKRALNERTVRQCIEADQAEKMLEDTVEVAAEGAAETVTETSATDAAAEDATVDDAAVDAGVDIADSTVSDEGVADPITQPGLDQPRPDLPQGQDQDQSQDGQSNDAISFSQDGVLNDSLMLMDNENDWDDRLA